MVLMNKQALHQKGATLLANQSILVFVVWVNNK